MDENNNSRSAHLGAHLKDAYQDTLDEGLPEGFRALIDANLKKGVEDTVQEGIPDRFRELLARLDDAAGDEGAT